MSRMAALRLIAALAILPAVATTIVIAFRPLQLPVLTMPASRHDAGQTQVVTLSDSSFRLAIRSAGFRANRIIPAAGRSPLAPGTARPPDPPKPQLGLAGLVLGAAAFILLQSLVSTYTERWMLILGVTFILFVLFAPGGIVGALRGRVGLRA